jgi:hypothetical protein
MYMFPTYPKHHILHILDIRKRNAIEHRFTFHHKCRNMNDELLYIPPKNTTPKD